MSEYREILNRSIKEQTEGLIDRIDLIVAIQSPKKPFKKGNGEQRILGDMLIVNEKAVDNSIK